MKFENTIIPEVLELSGNRCLDLATPEGKEDWFSDWTVPTPNKFGGYFEIKREHEIGSTPKT